MIENDRKQLLEDGTVLKDRWTMTPEEAMGRVARAKENTVMAQKNLKDLWALWMERRQVDTSNMGLLGTICVGELGQEAPDRLLEHVIERLEFALTDVKTVRDNLKASAR